MKIGPYTAVLRDWLIAEGLARLADVRLDSVEVNAGSFVPSPHSPIEQMRAPAVAHWWEGV